MIILILKELIEILSIPVLVKFTKISTFCLRAKLNVHKKIVDLVVKISLLYS